MPALGRRSHAITKNELPKVKWEHSHVRWLGPVFRYDP